jgi:hypothetical protein
MRTLWFIHIITLAFLYEQLKYNEWSLLSTLNLPVLASSGLRRQTLYQKPASSGGCTEEKMLVHR